MIKVVTITGADNSIDVKQLVPLSMKYPFVEWGILVSRKNFGVPRYPRLSWIKELADVKREYDLKLSCHLCGFYVRELSQGKDIAMQDLKDVWNIFDRVQINFHAMTHDFNVNAMIDLLLKYPEKEFIFQYDDVNNRIVQLAHDAGVNCSALFDTSGGVGILPNEWPDPLKGIKCGYAGGISPNNIEDQIKLIDAKTSNIETWIDMETHVRSVNDKLFDLFKVEQCLTLSSSWIKN